MAETENYGLYITDDSSTKFLDWRKRMNGVEDSNMIKIDVALASKQDELVGEQGQIVGFDENGNAIAQNNIDIGNQTPTYTRASVLTNLVSGERLAVAFGKLSKAVRDLITHLSDKKNPHGVTAEQVGASDLAHIHNYAGSVTPGGAANSATKLETARTVHVNLSSSEPASFDATSGITPGVAGTLQIANGGTGATTAEEALANLGGVSSTGTAASASKLATARTIRTNLGSTAASSFDGSTNITPGVTGTLPIANGGTGATSASSALYNLGGVPTSRTVNGMALSGNINLTASDVGALPSSGGTISGNLTLKGSNNFGTKINFGDNDYVHISEPIDDCMEIKAKKVTFVTSDTSDNALTLNGVPIGANVNLSNASGTLPIANGGTGATTAAGAVRNLGLNTSPVFTGSISLGRKSGSSVGEYSFAVGDGVEASRKCSHAEGYRTTASGNSSHSEGYMTTASGDYSHAEGMLSVASGECSHSQNYGTEALGKYQTAIGCYNNASSANTDKLIVGKGSSDYKSNCFRVTHTGVYATGNYSSSGADYAEMFEWADGNPDNEDRRGLFVTTIGDKIRIAQPNDPYVLGIVSGNASIIGDVHDDQWQGMYLYDIFGSPIWEDIEVPDVIDENGNIVIHAHIDHQQKINPDYDNTKKYTPRSDRPEWNAIGLLGKLVAVDDGSCEVNKWCTVGNCGVATKSKERTRYLVLKRLDDSHVKIMALQ